MTTDWREYVPCVTCGAQVSTEQPIKAWIRSHRDLDSRKACLCIGDSDLWVQRYGTRRTRWKGTDRNTQYLMLVEIKTHGRDLDEPQRDLLVMVNDLLRTMPWKEQRSVGRFVLGHQQNVRMVHSYIAGRWVQVLCYGVHKVRMDGATPDSSTVITWDHKEINAEQFAKLLRFELNPDSLLRMEDRTRKRIVDYPTLFDEEAS